MTIKNSIGHKYALEKLNQFFNESPCFKYIDIDDDINDWKSFVYIQLQKYCIIKDALYDIFDAGEFNPINNYCYEFILPTEDKVLTIINMNV